MYDTQLYCYCHRTKELIQIHNYHTSIFEGDKYLKLLTTLLIDKLLKFMKKILPLLLIALMFLCIKHQIRAQACTDFAVIVGNWGDASLQRFDGTTGNYSNQLATGIGARINSVLQYPSPNGNLYLGGYEEVNVVNAFTGAVSFSFTGGSLSGLTEQIVVGLDGNIYVASEGTGAGSGSIARYNATTGVFIDNFISFPSYRPNGLAQDASGNWYVSTRYTPNQVLKYNSSGVLQGIVTTMGTTENGGGLKVFNNELYVVTTDSPQTVKVYSLPVTSFPATPVRTLNTGGSTYVGIAFGPDNNMYMADFNNGRVSVWNPTTGTLVRNLTNSSIGNPHGVGFTTCTPCTPPTVGTAVATQATCTGSTANNDAKIDISGVSGGDKYSYGTDTTSFTYASATSFTGATISITGLANPSSATTYYVRVYNGSGLCIKTVSVVLQPKTCVLACTISAALSQVSCNNNATLASASDDYITALLTPTGTVGERFTLTATRGGNPIAVTFTDGTTIGQLSYAYPTPIRFANGSAGAGNIVLTLTDVANTTCSTTVTLTDPGTCAVTTCTSTPQTVSYAYRTTFQTTDLNAVPLVIPKFDTGGGRTLTKVELKFGMTQSTNSLTENTAATNVSFRLGLNTSSLIELGSTLLLDKSNTYSTGSTFITLPAGIVVPASGSYGGDQTYLGGPNLSTLEGMNSWLTPYMEDIVGVSPLTDPRWVTNATGVSTNDDDIFYIPTQTFANKDSVTYTAAGDLTQFVGTGNLPLTATTLNGITTTGGGGNLITKQNTKAYAYATVIYTYTCCTKPTVGTPVATQSTCTGSTANSDAKIDVTGISGGDKYSYGTDSTTFTYASATTFTGALINITGLANPSTATTYYVRVYNGLENCYKTVSVVLQPKTCITCPSTTYPLCAGESYTLSTPAGMTNVQWYKNGVVIAAPTGTATSLVATTIGDYVYTGIPSGGTCKDSLCCPVKIVAGTNCCVKPTVGTPVATQSTCTGSTANSDAKIDVAGVSGGDKYSYGTDSTAFAYASATAFTGASINITGLANPSTATTYYVRVYNGTDACYTDTQVLLQATVCNTPCGQPNCISIGVRKN